MNKSASEPFDTDASTCGRLAHFASRRPAAIAVVHRGMRVTYGTLAAHTLEVMDDLTAAGLHGEQVLGVEAGDRYVHLLILLAAEALGVATMSLTPSELGSPANLDRFCDRVVVSHPAPLLDQASILPMPLGWLANIQIRPAASRRLHELERQPSPDARVRLIKSSGTTGVPKVMGTTHRVQQRVIQKALMHAPPWTASHPDYLFLYNFGVRAAHTRALLTLQLGGTIHFIGSDVVSDLIAAGTGNYILFVTGDLERLVRTVAYRGETFPLHVDVVGAPVSRRLREEVRAKLTEHLVVTYSSNEVNRVSVVDEDNVGSLFPDVHIRIVDECGITLPMGQTGLICIRSDTMADGYLNAAHLTRTAFVDGWFHSNDFGFQPSQGKLVVLGRDDDMLNIGGVKIAPGPLEQCLKAIDGIRDALATGIDDHLETRVMLIAVEKSGDADAANLTRLITTIVRQQVTYFQLIILDEFPRTETGKIRREEIRELYRQAQHL